jgi:hypothetical protein
MKTRTFPYLRRFTKTVPRHKKDLQQNEASSSKLMTGRVDLAFCSTVLLGRFARPFCSTVLLVTAAEAG